MFSCFRCDRGLRYIYVLSHPDLEGEDEEIVVGKKCAEVLTGEAMPSLNDWFD